MVETLKGSGIVGKGKLVCMQVILFDIFYTHMGKVCRLGEERIENMVEKMGVWVTKFLTTLFGFCTSRALFMRSFLLTYHSICCI